MGRGIGRHPSEKRQRRRSADRVKIVSPPPNRDEIPEEMSRLFDLALRFGRDAVEEDFLAAVKKLSETWTVAEIEEELRRAGSLEAFLEGAAGKQAFGDFNADLRDSYEGPREDDGRRLNRHKAPLVNVYVSASDSATVLSPIRESWWTTQRWNQEAIDWADRVAANRVTIVSDGTKEGIRAIVKEAFEDGRDREWIARTLVALDGDGSLRLGLDARRGKTLMRFIADMDKSIPQARRKKLIDRRYRQLLKDRAATIAQTEVVQVGNEAQVATYQAASLEGELDSSIYVIEWVTRAIGCRRCIAMDGATREINSGRFVSDGSGPRGVETAEAPDLHPRGFCFTRIIRRSEAKRLPVSLNEIENLASPTIFSY